MFKSVKEILINNKIKFYSHTPREDKNRLLVLKNVSADYSENEVKEALLEIAPQFGESLKCNRMNFKDSDSLPFAYFRIQLPPNAIAKPLTDCKRILNQTVRWEPFRKHEIFQCHNCQRTGHPSSECEMGYRCVKCEVVHGPGECKRILDENNKDSAYCCNCKQKGHVASYRGCPYLRLGQELANERKQEDRQKMLDKVRTRNASRKPGISYSTALYARDNQTAVPQVNARAPKTQREAPLYSHTQTDKPLTYDAMRSLFAEFTSQIHSNINHHIAMIQAQINDSNNKINHILSHLGLQWP